MIPLQTLENYPVFGDNATKVAPDDAKYAAGFQQSDVLPAEWMNWAWNKNTKGITDLNQGMASIEKELIAVLTAAGITPSEATENQVITAIKSIQNKVYQVSVATTITPTGHVRYVLNANVQLSLNTTNVTPGTEVSILFVTAGTVYYKALSGEYVTDTINASRLLKYIYTGEAWMCSTAPDIGSIFKQYPDQDEPGKIHGGQWEVASYGGAFERSAGGNAKDFMRAFEGVTIAGTNVTFSESNYPTAEQLTAGDILIIDDQYRTVSSYNATTRTAVINSAFNSPNKTTVIIGQKEGLPNITGNWYAAGMTNNTGGSGASGALKVQNMTIYNGQRATSTASIPTIAFDASGSNSIYGRSTHVTPLNIAVQTWRRIN